MNVSGVGLIWDSGILLSGYAFTVCKRVNLLEKKKHLIVYVPQKKVSPISLEQHDGEQIMSKL